jgi:hypothetical protein
MKRAKEEEETDCSEDFFDNHCKIVTTDEDL